MEAEIDKSMPWGFFDGAKQNNLCGEGAILYLSESHSFEVMVGLGEGSNNYAELLSLKFLLIFAAKKGCRTLESKCMCRLDECDSLDQGDSTVQKLKTCQHFIFHYNSFRHLCLFFMQTCLQGGGQILEGGARADLGPVEDLRID